MAQGRIKDLEVLFHRSEAELNTVLNEKRSLEAEVADLRAQLAKVCQPLLPCNEEAVCCKICYFSLRLVYSLNIVDPVCLLLNPCLPLLDIKLKCKKPKQHGVLKILLVKSFYLKFSGVSIFARYQVTKCPL